MLDQHVRLKTLLVRHVINEDIGLEFVDQPIILGNLLTTKLQRSLPLIMFTLLSTTSTTLQLTIHHSRMRPHSATSVLCLPLLRLHSLPPLSELR